MATPYTPPASSLALPNFHAVSVPQFVQSLVGGNHLGRKPRFPDTIGGRRAAVNDASEISIAGHLEFSAAQRVGKAARNVEPIQFENRARIGRPPLHFRAVVQQRPRKNAVPIGV